MTSSSQLCPGFCDMLLHYVIHNAAVLRDANAQVGFAPSKPMPAFACCRNPSYPTALAHASWPPPTCSTLLWNSSYCAQAFSSCMMRALLAGSYTKL